MPNPSVAPDLQRWKGRLLRGKWRIDCLLGSAGMAHVFAATHRNGNRVAIKVLRPELAQYADVCARFLREGYVANAVEHPDAVRVLDDDTEDGVVFLVMELLDGESLEQYAAKHGGRLPVSQVLQIADRVLDVLTAAHARGIVHRDIKPSNVLLTRDGGVKVLDFGIASVRITSALAAGGAFGRNGTLGTPAFMPPEQARAQWDEVDARSDIWAVGAMMFTLLSGQFVHQTPTQGAATRRPARSLTTAAPHVPRCVVSVVDNALAFEKARRWPSASAMKQALRVAALEMSLSGPVALARVEAPDAFQTQPDEVDASSLAPTPVRIPLSSAAPAPARPSVSPSAPPRNGPETGSGQTAPPVIADVDLDRQAVARRRRIVAFGSFAAGAALLGPILLFVIGMLATTPPVEPSVAGQAPVPILTAPTATVEDPSTETPSAGEPVVTATPPVTGTAHAPAPPTARAANDAPPPAPAPAPAPRPRAASGPVAPPAPAPAPAPPPATTSWLDRRN
jgi:serine/threonine protein kinase